MTSPQTPPPAARREAADLGAPSNLILQGLLLSLATAIVGVTVALNFDRLGLQALPAIHLHAPRLGLIASAPLAVRIHLASVATALAIGIVLLIGVKGSAVHRILGWTWVSAMMTGAVSSLFIRVINHGALSYIHLLSGWTIVALPMAVAYARRHKVRAHARTMTGLFTGGLILAGLFAFIPGRLMWNLFF
jgi:uncharacterized membrane protein